MENIKTKVSLKVKLKSRLAQNHTKRTHAHTCTLGVNCSERVEKHESK